MGIITAISPQRKNSDRCSIFIDGKYALGVNKRVIQDMALEVGMLVEEEKLERIIYREELSKGREYALKLLEYRERSEWEIRDRMRRKGYEEKVVAETVEFLKNQNLVNDKRFARMWIESCLRRSYGRWKISSDLEGKGVDRELIDEVLKELYSGINETQIALELVERKWPSLKKEDNLMLRRISNFLKRRGFSFEVIADVMNQITD